jgi:hypothetical protein
MGSRLSTFGRFVVRQAFLVLLVLASVFGLIVAVATTAPTTIPDWALRSETVYRAEVGLAIFIAIYVISVSLRLAGQGRAFTKISAGTVSFETEQLAVATSSSLDAVEETQRAATELAEALAEIIERLDVLEGRQYELRKRMQRYTPDDPGVFDTQIVGNLTREVRVIHDRIDALEKQTATEMPEDGSGG